MFASPSTPLPGLAGQLQATGNQKAALGAAKAFEGQFLSQMFSLMLDSVETNPTFGGGKGEETWKTFLADEYGRLASQKGVGISSTVLTEILALQEASAPGIDR